MEVNFKVGDILHHTTENKNLGVIIHKFPDKLLLFRVDNNTHPTFSKIQNHNIHQAVVIGNINQYEFQDLKQHLLKYYRTRNISETEEALLKKVMTYAFPNGIPLYNSTEIPTEESLSEYKLVDKLIPGECFYLNTTKYTPFPHLDNQQTYVMEHTDKGLWVCLHKPTSNMPIYSFLPYLDKDVGKFHGISKVIPSNKDEKHYQIYQEDFAKRKEENNLYSQIEANETKCRVQPEAGNKIIVPHQYQGQYYDFKSGKIHNTQLNTIMDLNEQHKDKKPTSALFDNELDFSSLKKRDSKIENQNEELEINDDLSLQEMNLRDEFSKALEGGASKKIVTDEDIMAKGISDNKANENATTTEDGESRVEEPELELEEEDIQLLKNLDMKKGKSKKKSKESNKDGSNSETEMSESEEEEFDESQLELFEEDDIVIIGTETKMQQLPVPELEKTFKDDIQRGRIMKQKIERLPTYKRNNPLFIQDLEKEVNVINIMRNEVTKTDKSAFIPSSDFKPLVENYLQKNFSNPFLIPLVINRKKLYLTPKDSVSVDDFNKQNSKVYDNFYKLLLQENERGLIDRKQTIRVDEVLKQKLSDHTPFLSQENNLGLLVRLGEGINPDKTLNTGDDTFKSKNTRNRESIHKLQQETLTIRYGEKPFTIENFSATSKMFDAQIQLGPLARYITKDKSQITQEELEELENEVDKYSESIYSNYHIYYYGDAINIIGFVRPPLHYFLNKEETFNNGTNILEELNKEDSKDKVIVKHLNKLPNLDSEDYDNHGLDEPDKFVLYLFPGINRNGNINAEKCNINDKKLESYLNNIIPTIKDVSALFTSQGKSGDLDNLYDLLEKFDYIVPSRGVNFNSQKVKVNQGNISYETYKEVIRPLEQDYLRKMDNYNRSLDRMLKLKTLKHKKQGEKDKLLKSRKNSSNPKDNVSNVDNNKGSRSGTVVSKVVTNDIIELADKVFPEKLEELLSRMSGDLAKSDGFRLDYYSRQVDRGEYVELLLRKRFYLQLEKELDIEKLENTLSILKGQYESMHGDLEKLKLEEMNKAQEEGADGKKSNTIKVCKERMERKPKILTYPSLERLQQDNGRTMTNDKGEIIGSGDYAFLNIDNEKMIFKREELAEGDYWIQQPLETLRELLMKKKQSCEVGDEKDEGKMLLTGEGKKEDVSDEELDSCRFDIEELQCAPPMLVEKEFELKEVEKRMNDTASQISFGKILPQILSQIEKDLHKTEKTIVNYFKNHTDKIEYDTKKRLDAEKLLENTIYQKQPCPHFKVVNYVEGLNNITPMEKYTLMKQIMDEFQNTDQVATLELNTISQERKDNYAECFQCQQNLVCKHYYYAIDLMRHDENGELDEDQLVNVYGVEVGGSYYCKVCGEFLKNTDIKDTEEFAKGQGKEGFHIKTREVRDGINIIERQKEAVNDIIKDTLFGVGKDDKKDLEMKLRIYTLAKSQVNLEVLNMDDELEMYNYIKTANFTSKKVFFNQYFLLLRKAGKVVNNNVINQLADNKYWQTVTCDILARFLITLQTSKKVYPTYNKLCNSNYMGYPLTSDVANGEENMNGINLMISVMKQMSLLKDFTYLGSDAKGFEGLKTLLKNRIDFLVNNDEFIRSKLEKALDEKYNTITFDKELEHSSTNKWATFQPNMSLSTISTWTPNKEIDKDALKNWKGDNIYNMYSVAIENMEYQAGLTIRNMKKLIGEMMPLTRLTLDTSIGNACCPIYIPDVKNKVLEKEIIGIDENMVNSGKKGKLDTQKINKYINPKISSIDYLITRNVAINNSIKKMDTYIELSKTLEKAIAMDSIKFNFIRPMRVTRDDIPLNLQLSPELLRIYFDKYVYTGLFKGETYLFNAFGRCLISNQLKTDIDKMNFTQTDFEKLFHFVNMKNSKVDDTIPTVMEVGVEMITGNNEECIALNNLVKSLNNWLDVELKHLSIQKGVMMNIERLKKQLIEAIQSNMVVEMTMFATFMEKVSNLIDDYSKLWDISLQLDAYLSSFTNKSIVKSKKDLIQSWISVSLEEINKNTYAICLDNLKIKVLPKEVFNDKQNKFQIINMMDSIITSALENIVNEVNDVQKKGVDNEKKLLNIGEFPELIKDYTAHLDEQIEIRPNINYQNIDLLVQNFSYTKKKDLIGKMALDITLIINTIKNNSWSRMRNDENISFHLKEFFVFKDNQDLFGKLSGLSNALRNVISLASTTGKVNVNTSSMDDSILFTTEFSSKLAYMCLFWMLNDYLEVVDNKSITTLQENPEFDFKKMLHTKDESKLAELEKVKEEYNTLQGGADKVDNLDEESRYYPELDGGDGDIMNTVENYNNLEGGMSNEPGEQLGGSEDDNLQHKLKTVKSSQKKVIISFITKCIEYMDYHTTLYNDMNEARIEARIAKERERQTRANLEAWIRTSADGREEDRMVINNLMAIGALQYKDLNRITNEMFDDNFVGEEPDERPDGPSIRHGLDEYEQGEMGFVGEAEEMEEMDYGYMGVD